MLPEAPLQPPDWCATFTPGLLDPRRAAPPGVAAHGRYFRPPTLAELFGDRGFMVGNEGLRPERGTSLDGGLVVDLLRGRADLHAHAAGFAAAVRVRPRLCGLHRGA